MTAANKKRKGFHFPFASNEKFKFLEGGSLKTLFKKQKRLFINVKKNLLHKEAFSKVLVLLIKNECTFDRNFCSGAD